MRQGFSTLQLKRRAIAYGCLTDFGVSIAATILVRMIATAASSEPATTESMPLSAGFVAIHFILLLGGTAVGGYVAARFSDGAELTNALGFGAVMTILAVVGSLLNASPLQILGVLELLLTLPAAMIGGLVCLSKSEPAWQEGSTPAN